jgi:hypothetical protein
MEVVRAPDETIKHAKMRVGRSVVEMGEAHGPWQPMPTMFYLYVDDVDAAYRRALAAGAASMEEPAVQPYGERRAAARDAFDNQWYCEQAASRRDTHDPRGRHQGRAGGTTRVRGRSTHPDAGRGGVAELARASARESCGSCHWAQAQARPRT